MKKICFYIVAGISIALCALFGAVSAYYLVVSIYSIVIQTKENHLATIPEQIKWAIQYLVRIIGSTIAITCLLHLSIRTYGKNASIGDGISYEEYREKRMARSAEKKEKKRKRLEEELNRINH